ncbi:hypothetical protein J437_LFUL006668 [Ladona fulva]|uniref:COMM domain-containing protein n=1 Tax=Ladona fulva TaxID=123851 RepID=A0A8K0K5I3_LADFU|nr:hypothetical protein J437_LFUL006668 [Ladona fulva]
MSGLPRTMQLFLTDSHKQHLELVSKQDISVFREVCQIALDFVRNGPNLKAIVALSQEIEVPPQSLRLAIEGLIKLLIESFKNKLSSEDFTGSLQALGFREEQQDLLTKLYTEEGKILNVVGGSVTPPHFHNLDWRFEVQVASRSLLHQLTPLITMKLSLKDGETAPKGKESDSDSGAKKPSLQDHILQIDPVGLLHITGILEQALAEGSSRHCRRVQHSLE